MTLDDISTLYTANQALIVSLGALAGVAVLLVAANRVRAMQEHRATLLVANILTIIAAALATMVSASGMWKFFTDILGGTPLRIAFFAFIEIALFASALLARSRLLREPEKGTTGIDGIAVWILATLTATLSALDSDSFREVCLRLVAPLVSAWMWERALAAERHVRLGTATHRINWTLTPERIFVWLHLAEASDRDMSEVDRARRRATLGRARLHLHLLQSKKSFAWRIRRAHRKVIRQAMHAAEHIGLADFPHDATTERAAMQMYMATIYGFVEATSPQAVAHLNAWHHIPRPQRTDDATSPATEVATQATALLVPDTTQEGIGDGTAKGVNGVNRRGEHFAAKATHDDANCPPAPALRAKQVNGRRTLHGRTGPGRIVSADDDNLTEAMDRRQRLDLGAVGQRFNRNGFTLQPDPPEAQQDGTVDTLEAYDKLTGGDRPDDEGDLTAVVAMRRFWDREVAYGRVPTGAQLSRAAGIPPATGLGRRKRRQWQAELPQHLKTAAGSTR